MPTRSDTQTVKDGGTVYYAQGRYVMPAPKMHAGLGESTALYAEHPKYFDTLEQVYRDVDRVRKWPHDSTDRCVDVCSQPYWWDTEGKQKLGAAELLESVSFDAGAENAEISEWTGLTPGQRFARLVQQVEKLVTSKDTRRMLTTSDNAQQLPPEKEISPAQQQALIKERDRNLKALEAWGEEETG